MTSTSGTAGSVEATTELLSTELPRLEEHQQTLEKELASVTGRLESVRSALSALQALSLVPHVRDSAPQDTADAPSETESSPSRTEESLVPAPRRTARKAAAAASQDAPAGSTRKPAGKRASVKKTAPAKNAKAGAAKATAPAETPAQSDGLTEQIIKILSESGDSLLRARDVAQILGRDETPGSINAVRSTLDRLVATSRAHRAGRGLYQSPSN